MFLEGQAEAKSSKDVRGNARPSPQRSHLRVDRLREGDALEGKIKQVAWSARNSLPWRWCGLLFGHIGGGNNGKLRG